MKENYIEPTNRLIHFLKENGFVPISVHLKIDVTNVNVLITLTEADILKDEIIKAYDYVSNLEKTISEKLSFSFIERTNRFKEEYLVNDGYSLINNEVSL